MRTKTMILKTMFIAYVALISLVSMSESDPLTEPNMITGFTTDLIHIDSPQSPSYDPSLSPSQRVVNALQRSFNRAQHLHAKKSKALVPEPYIVPAGGDYLMKYYVGTPPVPSLGIADTASDLMWTQCQPCFKCFSQSLPIFHPKNSSTYTRIPCDSVDCQSIAHTVCSRSRRFCFYKEMYGDGSFSDGVISKDTFALASTGNERVIVPNIVFGCGLRNGGLFNGRETGIVGLGGGRGSLVRELGPLAQGKFSYCLIPLSSPLTLSKLHFGSNAEVSGSDVVSTPLVKKYPETFYFVTLEGISVGNQRLEEDDGLLLSDFGLNKEGNMIVDSGSSLTYLPSSLYYKLEKAIQSWIKLRQIKDPKGLLKLCFFSRKGEIIHVPQITVHLTGGDLNLKRGNVFVRTSDVSLCLAAAPTNSYAIYGNLAQRNFLVGYDLQKRTVSFMPTICDN